jgi:hypothetical protein
MTIIVLTILLTVSICVNVYFSMSVDRLYDRVETLSNWIEEYKNDVSATLEQLKKIDDRQIFQKDDDVGFVFSEILKLIEKLNKRTE